MMLAITPPLKAPQPTWPYPPKVCCRLPYDLRLVIDLDKTASIISEAAIISRLTWRRAKMSRPTRRDFLHVGFVGGIGLTLSDFFRIQSAQAEQKFYESKEGTAKSVIFIYLPGGMAHQERQHQNTNTQWIFFCREHLFYFR